MDVTGQFHLNEIADDLLRPNWVRTVKFVSDAVLGPQPWDDFWMGDTGRFQAVEGSFDELFYPVVTGLTITEDADGTESYDIETSEEYLDNLPNLYADLRRMNQRLRELERV